ncbi:hypothetical protein BKA61DRAFT_582431 [Leptodontidium sp. MPI-SDFR-AT-0119]|nr:hypothetical protein BKA61DRAFT_582431 [Leptodontidium sp. MPI-SDFR-AT-0119]
MPSRPTSNSGSERASCRIAIVISTKIPNKRFARGIHTQQNTHLAKCFGTCASVIIIMILWEYNAGGEDSVLHIQGIWREFYIRSLNVFLFLKCDESRSPALSKSDYEFIRETIGSGELFPEIVNPLERADIAQRLLASEELMPSLYTLIKDIRYLKQPAEFLSKLLPTSRFSTPKIKFEVTQDPAQAIVEKALRDVFYTLRPNEKFNFDAYKASPLIASFKEYINSQDTIRIDSTFPQITVTSKGAPLSCRYGHGPIDTRDLAHFFLDKIHVPLSKYRRDRDEISSFYIKRSRHIAFFSTIDLTESQEGPSKHLVPASLPLHRHQLDVSRPTVESTSFTPTTNRQARSPDKGRKLSLIQGPYFTWQDCFDILTRTKKSAVIITTVIESLAGKRRRGEDLPQRLQPATKEAFDFEMNEDEDEEEEL